MIHHAMSRIVGGQMLLHEREKEVLRKMLWQVADFCGVEVLTYCVMSNHFHVLVRVPSSATLGEEEISDQELMRRYKVLYPKPTRYQTASIKVLERDLAAGGEAADAVRQRLLVRMGDISEFMKTVKQRFSIWFNQSHDRFGTLWADRFKSVLVEGKGNPLQTMAAYIDLNPVRAGIVDDPKDYRFCGYAEAVAGVKLAYAGLRRVWVDHLGQSGQEATLQAHRSLLFGQGGAPRASRGGVIDRRQVVKVLEEQDGILPQTAVLRCRVRYISDGVILGSSEYVRSCDETVQHERKRKHLPQVNPLRGANWGDVTVIQNLRQQVFS